MNFISNPGEILSVLCKQYGKWGVYVNNLQPESDTYEFSLQEIYKAAPWMNEIDHADKVELLVEGFGYFLFDNEKEMQLIFDRTVGDDGPTRLNDYKGSWKIYCMT